MTFTSYDVDQAVTRNDGWGNIAYMKDSEAFALLLDGEAVLGRKTASSALGEGATDVWVVIEINGRLFKKDGYHESHYGTDWDGSVNEVRPKQKTITVYETV